MYQLSELPPTSDQKDADIKNKNIFGRLVYKESQELETYNFIELRDNKFICYNSEKEPYSSATEGYYTFKSFEDTGMCFKEKFVVDLTSSRIYISSSTIKRSFLREWLCCWSRMNIDNLVEMTDRNIYKIVDYHGKYHVYLDKSENYIYLELKSLEFVLYYRGSYHTFRSKNIVEYLKWISAIQVRNTLE